MAELDVRSNDKMNDEHFYEAATKELVTTPRRGLLAKCAVEADGDITKAHLRYIKIRVAELSQEAEEAASHAERRRMMASQEEARRAIQESEEQIRRATIESGEKLRLASQRIDSELSSMPNHQFLNATDKSFLVSCLMSEGTFDREQAINLVNGRFTEREKSAKSFKITTILFLTLIAIVILLVATQ